MLINQYYGTNAVVDPKIQAGVQKEMADSYQHQIRPSIDHKGETSMEKNYTPVTIEDYDNSMRATVNAFYEHAKNDPSLSHDEAVAQTGQMAENCLNTMDELQTAHENGEIASVNDNAGIGEAPSDGGASVSGSGLSDDGGLGDDGGVGDDDGGLE